MLIEILLQLEVSWWNSNKRFPMKELEQHSKILSLITLELDLTLEMVEDNLSLHN